jgi:hypothetical protein
MNLIGAFRIGSTNEQSNHTLVWNLAQMCPIPARTPTNSLTLRKTINNMKAAFCPDTSCRFSSKKENKKLTITQTIIVNISCSEFHTNRTCKKTRVKLSAMPVTYLLTYSMDQSPSWEADQFSQLTKKFPAFYGTWRFFTVLKSARHTMPFTVSIFTELTIDQRHCMEVCYAIHCIDFQRTDERSTTLHA